MHGYESVVGPVKGVYNKPELDAARTPPLRAREHTILINDRPPYVSILTLVREAAARLPNGCGTRADIVELLKYSQYVSPAAPDGLVHSVVSGALDRLHYEPDPCVKFSSSRKMWVYLHRNRSEHDFSEYTLHRNRSEHYFSEYMRHRNRSEHDFSEYRLHGLLAACPSLTRV